MRARLLAPLAVFLVAGSVAGATTRPNVRGTLVRAPVTVGCPVGEPCDPPPAASFIVFARSAHATRARLTAAGTFALRLAPGLYRVSLAPPVGTVKPATLRVPRSGVIHPRLVEKAGGFPAPA
jgi:hypothetical protein